MKESRHDQRELIGAGTDKRCVRKDENGKFKESVDVSLSLSADARHDAKPGQGDKGDHKRRQTGEAS
jgi:hypothetical protein